MHLKYNYTPEILYKKENESYYILGAFITDGCVYKNGKTSYACQLTSKDYDWLKSISVLLGTNLKLHKFKKNYFGIRITRNEIAKWFINQGCAIRKTYNISLPKISDIYFSDFLRGCIDGDGTLGTYYHGKTTKRSCQLISASLEFLKQIQEKITSLNIKSTITNRGKQNSTINGKKIIAQVNSYSLNFYGTNCYKLLKFIYYSNHTLSLERKNNLAKEIIDYYESQPVMDKRKARKLNQGCKILWPSNDELIILIKEKGYEKLSKELNVHSTSIRNRLKRRGLYLPFP